MEFHRLVVLTGAQTSDTALAAVAAAAMNRYLIFKLERPNASVGEQCAMVHRACFEVIAVLPSEHPTRDWIEEFGAQLVATIQREGG